MATCNCFDETLERVKTHIHDQLKEEVAEFKAEWEGYSFFLDGNDHVPVNPRVAYEYRGFKKNGSPRANMTRDTVSLMARYCPFCGIDTKDGDSVDS